MYIYNWFTLLGFPGDSAVKNLPAMQETRVWSLGWDDPLEEGMATYSRILAWRIPEEPGRLQSMGSNRVECNWTDLACVHNILLSFGPCFPLWLISYRLTVSAPCTEILEVLQMSNVHISLLVCAYSLLCMAHPSHLSLFLLHNSCPHFHSAFPFRIWHIISIWAIHIKWIIKWM